MTRACIRFDQCDLCEHVTDFPDECWFIIKVNGMTPQTTKIFQINRNNKLYYFCHFVLPDDELYEATVKVTLCCFSANHEEMIPFACGKFSISNYSEKNTSRVQFIVHSLHLRSQDIANIHATIIFPEESKIIYSPVNNKSKHCCNAYVF